MLFILSLHSNVNKIFLHNNVSKFWIEVKVTLNKVINYTSIKKYSLQFILNFIVFGDSMTTLNYSEIEN